MKSEHRIIREMLKQMPLPAAKKVLETNLPYREFVSIYYADCEKEALDKIGEEHLGCEEPTVKKYRFSGYKKLATIYFPKQTNPP